MTDSEPRVPAEFTDDERERITTARSFLFTPGDRPARFAKAEASGADMAILDLEDGVGPEHKRQARTYVARWLDEGHRPIVRINAAGTEWHADDIAMLTGRSPIVMVPKAESRDTLDTLAARLGPGAVLIPLIETAVGVLHAADICLARNAVRVAFGNVDLATQLGVDSRNRAALDHARSAVVLGAAAAAAPAPIDGVTTGLADPRRLDEDILRAKELGFTAKLCIHPGQIRRVNSRFFPSAEEIAWANEVCAAAGDGAAVAVAGAMIDRPVVLRAQAIVKRAASKPIPRTCATTPSPTD